MLHNGSSNEGGNKSNILPKAGRRIQVVVTETEFEAFKEALRTGEYRRTDRELPLLSV